MDRHGSSLKGEPKLYSVRHVEALIESASWVKSKRDGLRLVIGMVVTAADETERCLADHFSQHASDQERLERLCSALNIDPLLFTLDDLVARKVGVVEKVGGLKTKLQTVDISYFPLERRPQKREKR